MGPNEKCFKLNFAFGGQNSKYFIAYFTKMRLIPEGDLLLLQVRTVQQKKTLYICKAHKILMTS